MPLASHKEHVCQRLTRRYSILHASDWEAGYILPLRQYQQAHPHIGLPLQIYHRTHQ